MSRSRREPSADVRFRTTAATRSSHPSVAALAAPDRVMASRDMVFPMRSRAEGGIDQIVYEKFFAGTTDGVMVEVGAAGPEQLSMSALYREAGWRVIAVEPNPVFCQAWRNAGLNVLEYACADRDEDDVPFEVVDSHGTIYEGAPVSFESMSSLGIRDSYRAVHEEPDSRTIRVNVRRLDTLLAEHAPDIEALDLLAVDTEGWDARGSRRARVRALPAETVDRREPLCGGGLPRRDGGARLRRVAACLAERRLRQRQVIRTTGRVASAIQSPAALKGEVNRRPAERGRFSSAADARSQARFSRSWSGVRAAARARNKSKRGPRPSRNSRTDSAPQQ